MEMQESIVEAAGQIWNYLNTNGEVTTKKNAKRLKLRRQHGFHGSWLVIKRR